VQTISCTKVPGISSCIDYSCQFFVCYRWERRSRPGSMVAWLVCLQELACIDWTVCGSVKLASPRRAQHGRSDVRLPACWRGGDGQQDMAAATGAMGAVMHHTLARSVSDKGTMLSVSLCLGLHRVSRALWGT
jgi:hypothetical protein